MNIRVQARPVQPQTCGTDFDLCQVGRGSIVQPFEQRDRDRDLDATIQADDEPLTALIIASGNCVTGPSMRLHAGSGFF